MEGRALAGLELRLKEQAGEPLAAELDAAKRHIGELSMDNELLRSRARAAECRLPYGDAEVATMSQTTSATTGRRYGLERVCRTCERSRSALYARRARLQRPASDEGPRRRGPTLALSDAQLLAAIRSDLARSPFQGEGHRKVHARLRILDGVRVSRMRVMRAQGLLSPYRGRQGEPKRHDGTIVTSAPDVMWGTDGTRGLTVDNGWVWTFAAIDHWNAECVGWHVCKVGNHFAALEPVAQGLRRRCGSVEADAGRGLALRMDHGSQYLSDHFLNQVRYWGIRPSFGLLEEPETNGVAERWNRTLKEQAVYGRVFRNLADVRAAVAEFVERYNRCWRGVRATPGRVAQTCVQETGCGTTVLVPHGGSCVCAEIGIRRELSRLVGKPSIRQRQCKSRAYTSRIFGDYGTQQSWTPAQRSWSLDRMVPASLVCLTQLDCSSRRTVHTTTSNRMRSSSGPLSFS